LLIQKAINIKLFPDEAQTTQVNKTIGCKRFVFNNFLGLAKTTKYTSYNQLSKELTLLKSSKLFLKEVDKFAMQNALKDLDDAFKRFFKKQNKYPKFKSKKTETKSYRTNFTNNNIKITSNYIQLPKLGKVKINKKINLNNIIKINSVTVKKVNNSYYASVQIEYNYTSKMDKPINSIIGIDVGIKHYLTTYKGIKIANPKYFKKCQKKLAKLQQKASRCVKYSKNQQKLFVHIAKLHAHIANSRKDFQHKLSNKLISENQTIVVESLTIKNMLKNKKLSKYIVDCAWSQFITFLEYKALWNGRTIIKAATKFPSSQRCSCCGYINKAVKDLKVRTWECPNCHSMHDRDLNASKNLELYGLGLV